MSQARGAVGSRQGRKRFVIVGNGLAGHRAALELRRHCEDADITLVGADSGLPYDRPPLTKDFLLGNVEASELMLRGADRYREMRINYHPSLWIEGLDRDGRKVFGKDIEFDYDALLLATGSRPRRYPGLKQSEKVHYIRSLPDAERLRKVMAPGRHIAVIGGGFIGLEVAASARELGCEVTIIEAQDRLAHRAVPKFVSRFLYEQHVNRGVRVLLNASIEEIDCERPRALLRMNATDVEADAIVIGIGVLPNTELAAQAGLGVRDGILVDRHCRTSDPYIFAAGEVTAHPSDRHGSVRRVESWRIASEQPLVAAASMLGMSAAFRDPPWLWSDQFGINIQVIGSPGEDSPYLFHGDIGTPKWIVIARDSGGLPTGAAAVNDGRNISLLRRLIREGQPLPPALGDICRPLDNDFMLER